MKTALILFFLVFHSTETIAQLYEMEATKNLMGTEFKVIGYDEDIESLKKVIYYTLKEVERIEQVMSIYIPENEASNINERASYEPVTVSDEMFGLLKRSVEYSKKYLGLFDITIGAVSEHWGINRTDPIREIPSQKIIDSLVSLTGYEYLILDDENSSVRFGKAGLKIDLGGIAKGYAIDRAAKLMSENGIENFIISGGGDVFVSGKKAGTENWNIGMKYPDSEVDSVIAVLLVEGNCAVTSSGDYERFIEINGVKYHHIFNPFTGFPDFTSNTSTVVTATSEEGVVLSKILFMLGENFALHNYQNDVRFAFSLKLLDDEYSYDPEEMMRR